VNGGNGTSSFSPGSHYGKDKQMATLRIAKKERGVAQIYAAGVPEGLLEELDQ